MTERCTKCILFCHAFLCLQQKKADKEVTDSHAADKGAE